MNFYTSLIILTELLMVAMILHVLHYSGFNKSQKGWFIATFSAIMLCSAAEFAVHCGYYDPQFAIPLTILTVLQFSVSPVLGMLFCGALGLKKQGRIAIIFFAASLLIEIICAPFGWVFHFDADGYHRGVAFYYTYGAFYFASLAYLLVALFFVGRSFKHRDLVTIIMILVVLIAGIVPMTIPGLQLHVTYSAIGMSSCICYIYYNDLVQEDTRTALIEQQKKIQGMQEHIISGLANLIESRDAETGTHVARTSLYCKILAEDARNDGVYADVIDDHFIQFLTALAPMHDVGKIVVSDKILRKPGRLTPEEYKEMQKHAAMGGAVVRRVLDGVTDEDYLNFAADIATYHHEWWDGNGYPEKKQGEEIPLSARIMAIADAYDALISERCYKSPIPYWEAFDIIEKESGTHFDPKLVQVFLAHKEHYTLSDVRYDEKPKG